MHDFYRYYVCPSVQLLLCPGGVECLKCNPATYYHDSPSRNFLRKPAKWTVTTCKPTRYHHETTSVCQYGMSNTSRNVLQQIKAVISVKISVSKIRLQ